MTLSSRIRALSFALLPAAALLAGCAVPLGPGFYFRARQTEVAAVPSDPARVHVRVTDQLTNVGNRDLSFLDVKLPSGPSFGTANLAIRVGGSPEPSAAPQQQGAPFRVRFDPAWKTQESRTVVFDYDFEPAAAARGVIAATDDSFHIADVNALPQWLLPSGPFAKGDQRARGERLDVTVPSSFRILSGGREVHQNKEDGADLYQYRISPDDVPPFVVGGHYEERRVRTRRGDVVFWTVVPLDAQAAAAAGERLAGAARTYEEMFGPVPGGPFPVRVVESPGALIPAEDRDARIGAAAFPRGVLLDTEAIAGGISTEPVLETAEYELSRTWFGWVARPDPDAQILLGRGMGLFAVVLAEEARGGQLARRQAIVRLIASYDRINTPADVKPLIEPPVGYTRPERRLDAFEAALFFAALEDQAGRENLKSALRRMLQARAGSEIAAEDLRSAMEAATGRNLAEMFHAWLDRLMVPDDFRARYAETK